MFMGEIWMKKVLFVILVALFLSACNDDVKIHEDVDEEVAKDALQLMDIVTKNVDEGITYEDSDDKGTVDEYYKKYLGEFSYRKDLYSGVDEDILIIANATATRYIDGITLETEIDSLKESEERLKEFISTGEGYNLGNDDSGEEEDNQDIAENVSHESVDYKKDALEVARLVDTWFNSLNTLYVDLPGNIRDVFVSYDQYKDEPEAQDLYEEVLYLIGKYSEHGTELDNTDEINESIKEIRNLSSDVRK